MKKFVYSFNEGSKEMRNLLGNKGAALAEMMQIGMPVPFGFTVTTEACRDYTENGSVLTEELTAEIYEKLSELESVTGKTFGDPENPLSVSVRTGIGSDTIAAGMTKTVMNVGAGAETAEEAKKILLEAVTEAFDRWNEPEAAEYRRRNTSLEGAEECADGVAVSVQAMVFGDAGEDCATGILSTRDCISGEKKLCGCFLRNTQGPVHTEDEASAEDFDAMREVFPKAYESLVKIAGILERHYKETQNIEFTIEHNKLYILQTQSAERTPAAALKMAVDMVDEQLITKKTALLRLDAEEMRKLVQNERKELPPGEELVLKEDFGKLLEWADEIRDLKVRANADDAVQAKLALSFGAEGIGLCRTENMFFDAEKLKLIREMFLTGDEKRRERITEQLKQSQKENCAEIFRIMGERPVAIRLLDLPMNDILPMEEENPMLGNRGCRLELAMPYITEAQTEAVVEAAIEVKRESGIEVQPEILIPMISTQEELAHVKNLVMTAAKRCMEAYEETVELAVGTMIETPRAALTADKIAAESDFFSFGTNDLTQMVYGLSREDAGLIVDTYIEKGILKQNPFKSLDTDGVGRLVELAAVGGKRVKPKLKLGICGEQACDPASIEFCHCIGMSYLSVSPLKVPIAKLAAAQAAVRNEGKNE